VKAVMASMQRRPRNGVPTYRGEMLSLAPGQESPDPGNLGQTRAWVASRPHPTAIDLFCGAGGMSLGLQEAGFSVLVGADMSELCVETHRANIGGLGYEGDLADPEELLDHLRAWGIDSVDLIAGGVPCQPFSRAGRSKIRSLVVDGSRSQDDPRAHLWDSFVRIVEALRPRAVLLENVPDLAAWGDGAVLIAFREALHDLGYATEARILNAFDFGVPQHRTRLFIVGLLSPEGFQWPASSERSSLRDAIGDLPAVDGGQRDACIPYRGTPQSHLQKRLRSDVPDESIEWIFDHITRAVRPDDAEAFSLLAPGGTYADLPNHLRRYRSDIFKDKYKRLEWDRLSRSITAHIAKDGYSYIHPEQDRTLSVREAARIQTFPDWFRFAGTPSHRYAQIGNAVPPMLAEAIGRNLLKALAITGSARDKPEPVEAFRSQLLQWHLIHSRRYPWRTNKPDGWHALIAELALARTRPSDIERSYAALVKAAPTPRRTIERQDIALSAMASLGLGTRANLVIMVAQSLVDRHAGVVPDTEEELMRLPGVGEYVANAVLTFAFGRRAVLMDTTTERVISRIQARSDIRRWQLRLDLYEAAGRSGPDTEFNRALLDLGAIICRPTNPHCMACPVNAHCSTGTKSNGVAAVPLSFNF
jgi:DNA (cytosine-5)-methyltransferase 1